MQHTFSTDAVEWNTTFIPPIYEPAPRQHILVADYEADPRRLIADALSCLGYQVDSVADGLAAWQSLQVNSYDLLILDTGVPQMTGVDLLHRLYTYGYNIPVILRTAVVPPLKSTQRPFVKPAHILLKPHTLDELLEAVKNVLQVYAVIHGTTPPPPNWSRM